MATMTYLQLCQRVAKECGVSTNTTVPSTITAQTGILGDIVNWVATAWEEIQARHQNWRWMRSRFSVSATVGDDSYAYGDCTDDIASAAISRFRRWWPLDDQGYNNAKIYLTSAGVGTENWLRFIPYASFRSIYKIGTQTNGYPAFITVDPQNNLLLGPAPDGTYTVSGEYQRGGLALDDDNDTPDLPADFHMLIVWRAAQKYGEFKSAPEVFSRAVRTGNILMRQLELDQLPPMATAGPLA